MKKYWFQLLLLSLALVLGVAVWGVLNSLWKNLEQYEASSEIGAVSEYFRRFSQGDYETVVQMSGFSFDDKNTKEDYIQYLKDTFGTDFSDLRFAGRDSHVAGEKEYRVYSGNTPLGSVRLVPVQGGARNWNVIAEVNYSDPVKVVAPSYVQVAVNGRLQPPDADSTVTNVDFADLEGTIQVPTQVTYTLDGYLYAPEVRGTAPDGTVCIQGEPADGTVSLFVPVSETDREQFESLVTEFSKNYARFISKDASFASLKTKMLAGTEFYESARTFYNGWYTPHTGHEFRDVTVSDLIRTDENTFVGNIKFDYVVFRGTQEYVYPSSYRLSFCCSDGEWLLADLTIR